jgi:hypothetical protein
MACLDSRGETLRPVGGRHHRHLRNRGRNARRNCRKFLVMDQESRRAIGKDWPKLGGIETPVERHVNGAGTLAGKGKHDRIDGVARQYGDTLAVPPGAKQLGQEACTSSPA